MSLSEINAAVQDLVKGLAETHPEIGEVLAAARAGGLTEAEAMARLIRLVRENPEMASSIEEIGMRAFQPLREPETAMVPVGETRVVVVDGEEVPLVVQTGPGLPRLNPHYEAALAERLQFDGDIPEARTGSLPPGSTPAVPVETSARNMAAIGKMLETASEEVMEELDEVRESIAVRLQAEQEATTPRIGEGFHKTGAPVPAQVTTAELWEAKDDVVARAQRGAQVAVGVEAEKGFIDLVREHEPTGYRTGETPDLLPVQTPSGASLAALSPEDRNQAAWRALSTTQGRRTALRGIQEMIAIGLANEGIELVVKTHPTGRLASDDEVLVYEDWKVELAGPKGTQGNFAFMDTAAKVLLSKLVKHDLKGLPGSARLEVLAVNTVSINQVGWAARIVVKKA